MFSFVVAFEKILPYKETSCMIMVSMIVATMIPNNVRQLQIYLQGCIKPWSYDDEVRNVRAMVIEICMWCGVMWRTPIPFI